MQFRMIGAVGREPSISTAELQSLLANPVRLNTGDGLRGRITTRLHVSDNYVLKLKSDFALQESIARDWAERQLARERGWNIYHPGRSWGLALQDDGLAALFNVTPRLQTLNNILAWDDGGAESLELLGQVLEGYFRFYQSAGLCLDFAPANYGVEDGRCWYIDDDVYGDDSLISFAHSLGNVFRRHAAWPETSWLRLGERLRAILATHPSNLQTVAEHQLRQLPLFGDAERARDILMRAFDNTDPAAPVLPTTRFALLADIHGNLPALRAIYHWLDARGIDSVLVLGDIVGYGPWPGECIDLLHERRALCIRGNHDEAAATGVCGTGFNRAARWSAPWTLARLSDAQRAWLGALPLVLTGHRWMAVHGSAVDPEFINGYVYARTAETNLDWLQEHKVQVCLHGHSHIPGTWYRERRRDGFRCEARMHLDSDGHYLVCPGSVGHPRNGSHEAQFMVIDPESGSVEFHQVPYEREELLCAVAEHGFPDMVASLYR